ncbi:2-deoxystreptamine N-acetyl-D-glucosaminyltransferase [mine drainage metagenome]|uniref:2-deoxystreptamine N-acetyl-D-glucosaminyltransferase n=1 Tax=mine drainage metagenome TaxID=410659 RepID=A0A1J5QZ61_9ZZZZ
MGFRRLTVLQVLPALAGGGVERGTLEVGKFLVEHGHRSMVMSAGGRMVEQLTREGSEHFAWAVGAKSLMTLRLISRLRRFLVEQQVDVLHVRSRMPAWIAWLAWRGMNPATRPHLVTTVHGMYSVSRYSAIMMKGERVIAVSDTIRRYILNNYPEVPAARIALIPRGVDPAEFPHGYRPPEAWLDAWRAQYPQLEGRLVLTLPGRLTRLKGHEDFIRLIGRLKARGLSVHGLIVGGEDPRRRRYAQQLLGRVAGAGMADAITFTGHRSDLREIMAVSDIVLSLSSKPESFGRTSLEALSLGVPVIGYDHGGVGETLRAIFPEGAVPLGQADALEDAVVRNIRPQAGIAAAHNFLLQHMLERTIQVYEELVSPLS